MFKRFLLGSVAAFFAPEDDRGSAFDDVDTDLNLDELDPDGALDDEPNDDQGGGDDDQGGEEDEGQGGADDEGGDQGGRQPSRRERDVGGLRARTREAERRATEAERRLNELVGGQQREQQQRAQQAERELLESMTEGERLSYMLKKQSDGFNAEISKLRFEQQDAADQVKFDSLCTRNPTADKLKGEVEKKLKELRATGQTAPRETILKFVLGERALERAAAQGGKQRKRAGERVARQTTRPASPRSDAAADDRRALSEKEARAKRLENIQL